MVQCKLSDQGRLHIVAAPILRAYLHLAFLSQLDVTVTLIGHTEMWSLPRKPVNPLDCRKSYVQRVVG